MQSEWVVEGLDVVEDGGACFGAAGESAAAEQVLRERGEEALGDGVVVAEVQPIEISMPASRQRSPKSKDTYCEPWSE